MTQTENLITICTSEEADSWIIQHGININLGVNNYEVSIQTVDSDVFVLSFGYANIVKDAGVETFSMVYGPKEISFGVFDYLSYFGKDFTWFTRAYWMRYNIQFLTTS